MKRTVDYHLLDYSLVSIPASLACSNEWIVMFGISLRNWALEATIDNMTVYLIYIEPAIGCKVIP